MDKHFEPVTARSLAIKLYDLALESSKRHSMEYEDCIVLLAGVLEPHIRKPSDDDESKPTLLPFSLEDAKNGAKVVTRKLIPVKIIADDLDMQNPILGIIDDGKSKISLNWMKSGRMYIKDESDYDLFILKEPETVEIGLYRHKYDNSILVHDVASPWHSGYMGEPEESKLIKTITVQI